MKLAQLPIRIRFLLLLTLSVIGFLVYAGWSYLTVRQIEVNGPIYQRIVQSKDLVADVLPPPAYVLEPYLVALQLGVAADKPEQDRLIARFMALKGDYTKSHERWVGEKLEAPLGELLVRGAHDPALKFFELAETQLIPSVKKGDHEAVAAALTAIAPAYEAQRKAIDQVVELANQRSARDEVMARESISSATWASLLILVFSIAASVGNSILIIRSITVPLHLAVNAADRVAAGDLTVEIEPGGQDELGRLSESLRRMQSGLAATVSSVRQNAHSVAQASEEIAKGNHDLSERTERQASALQETAASMEELDSTVRKNAENAVQANQLARGASKVALRGSEVVGQVVNTMKGINDSSRRISEIIGVIDGIAFQTNILALNAAVEAARAGDQGRGFAVVAGEVRSLAQRSAEAAKEIKGLITASVERVENGSQLVDQAGQTMEEVVGAIQRVSAIVADISLASSEQSSGVTQVGQAISQMDQVTQQNAALVEESAAAAEGLKRQAGDLVNAVAVFVLPGHEVVGHLGRGAQPVMSRALARLGA